MHAEVIGSVPFISRYLRSPTSTASDVGSMRFRDVHEQASALTGWNQDYLQLSAGAFQGEICQLQGTGIKLFAERVQQSVFQTGTLPSNVLAIGVPLESVGMGMFCGRACGADDLHLFSGAAGFEFRTSRQHVMLGVELQLEHGWMNAGSDGQDRRRFIDLPTHACTLRLAPEAVAELRTYLLTLFQSTKSNSYLLSSSAVVATVADFLLDYLAGKNIKNNFSEDTCTSWKLVQRAGEMVSDSQDQAPTVAQLCQDLGVSRRTLQNSFQRVLNISPLAYLKAFRLDQARRALKRASSVTEAATTCGFWHFGNFSHDYQAMFGERPSDTLRHYSAR